MPFAGKFKFSIWVEEHELLKLKATLLASWIDALQMRGDRLLGESTNALPLMPTVVAIRILHDCDVNFFNTRESTVSVRCLDKE